MLELKDYINIGYEISKISYRGQDNLLAGTGEGNKFSGDMYQDILSLIIK